MAVGAHMMNTPPAPAPAELTRAINYQSWGVVDVMSLPAGLLPRMNAALDTFRAIQGYQRAAGKNEAVKWSKDNPRDWDLVSWIMSELKVKHGNRN